MLTVYIPLLKPLEKLQWELNAEKCAFLLLVVGRKRV